LAKKTLTVSVPFDEGRHVLANDYTLVGLCVPLVSTPFDSRVVLTDKDREYGRRQLGASGVADEAPIAMHPGGGTFRSWQAERFGALANRLTDHCGCSVVVMSGPGEEDVAETVRSAAKHERVRVLITEDYYAFQVAVSHARAFIGNDTGPTHIAAACGVPTVAVFGSTSSTIFAPPGPHVRVVERKQPCTPCRVPWREPETCMRDRECLLAVDVDTVFDAVKALLDQETGSPE
jgi:ADP-heptose:LPS heptosyltransferase